MSYKYLVPMSPPNLFGPGGGGCSEEAVFKYGGALAYDEWTIARTLDTEGCWLVTGIPIPIGPTGMSDHEGMEMFNVNMRAVGGSLETLPTNIGLQGAFVV